jgi:hypothetical protein
MAKRAFGIAALLLALPCHEAAVATVRAGQATAVIREGIAIHSWGEQTFPKVPREERTVRTIVRPCSVAEPHILCSFVLIEVH